MGPEPLEKANNLTAKIFHPLRSKVEQLNVLKMDEASN